MKFEKIKTLLKALKILLYIHPDVDDLIKDDFYFLTHPNGPILCAWPYSEACRAVPVPSSMMYAPSLFPSSIRATQALCPETYSMQNLMMNIVTINMMREMNDKMIFWMISVIFSDFSIRA